ncbi:hypothetical protein V5P93_003480 [Actinokineospora auranticolor]|uniref:Uncharacterized protein n=1 Tax=Actinokineospora auranticolor TaxID=155976 RepID=A0A2S6GPQ1_9PSEU|nr:hypothetical protein [Actinokineospora auranticolor]PPK67143.1 hypothetical protein CLV40_108140 [Actinokineospora auranticolor]
MTQADCGCGCGGTSAHPAAFVRPRFFAGQLLTEDDLGLLVDYVAGKDRLHNRTVLGPGVVCGLEVGCDPCGGGTVVVRPGHALDCCGNDIVVSCQEKVDVQALVREARITASGVDCGDPCDDDQRHYGLYIRYEETPIAPVAPFSTEEPCPTPGCVPSRIQEGFRFVVKCDTADDHRYNPVTRLLASVGTPGAYEEIRLLCRRLGFYLDPMHITGSASTQPVEFTADDRDRYTQSLAWLRDNAETTFTPPVAREATERVRALASAVARHDTYADGDKDKPTLDDIADARRAIAAACDRLAQTDHEQVWPDRLRRSPAAAVTAEAKARIANPDADALIEVRLVALGTPIDNVLNAEFRSDLARIREWLLNRLDKAPGVADCALRDYVRATTVPQPVPTPEPDSGRQLTLTELGQLAEAAARLTTAVRRFIIDAMCATLNPPCTNCTDTDVLLAHLTLDGCEVVRVCSATREQVLPGGSAYGEWLFKLAPLRGLAERLCCQPTPVYRPPVVPSTGPVRSAYVVGLLDQWKWTGDVEDMWSRLVTLEAGETLPKTLHEQVYSVPSEVTDSLREMGALRWQVNELTRTVDALRAQLDTARDQVTQVRTELPERLEDRLAELERAPAAEGESGEGKPRTRRPPRSSSRKPQSGGESG